MHIHFPLTTKISSMIVAIIGVSMLPSLLCAIISREAECIRAFSICAGIYMLVGFALFKIVPSRENRMSIRDGYLTVAVSWILASLLGAVPFLMSGAISDYTTAFFESAAGFTTTGCTALVTDAAPKSILLWKATSNWLGGMGILVFTISVLPMMGINSFSLAAAETTGPKVEKFSNRFSDSARILYITYLIFTVLEFMLLLTAGLKPFDALVDTMGAISTGGMIAHSAGLSYYNSFYVEAVVAVFSVLATTNFVLYYNIVEGEIREFFRNVELRVYLAIIFVASLAVTGSLYAAGTYDSLGESARYGFVQTIGFISTSGYAVTNFSMWPSFARMILFTTLFIGGCAASTAGSIKVTRIIILTKMIMRGFTKRLHPRSVKTVKVQDSAITAPVASEVTSFVLVFIFTLAVSTLVLSLQGLDFETTVSAAMSCLSNCGTALGQIGESCNFGIFSEPLQVFMGLVMIVGRLEIFTFIFLLSPSFWKSGR